MTVREGYQSRSTAVICSNLPWARRSTAAGPAVRRDHARREHGAQACSDPPAPWSRSVATGRRSVWCSTSAQRGATRGPRFPSCSPRRRARRVTTRAVSAGGSAARGARVRWTPISSCWRRRAWPWARRGGHRGIRVRCRSRPPGRRRGPSRHPAGALARDEASQRSIVGKAAKPVADRSAATARRIPKRAAPQRSRRRSTRTTTSSRALTVRDDRRVGVQRRPQARLGPGARQRSRGEVSVRHVIAARELRDPERRARVTAPAGRRRRCPRVRAGSQVAPRELRGRGRRIGGIDVLGDGSRNRGPPGRASASSSP